MATQSPLQTNDGSTVDVEMNTVSSRNVPSLTRQNAESVKAILPFEMTKECLMHQFHHPSYQVILWYLRLTGAAPPREEPNFICTIIQYIWNAIVVSSVTCFIVIGLQMQIEFGTSTLTLVFGICLILQSCSLIFSLYLMSCRLSMPVSHFEIPLYSENLMLCVAWMLATNIAINIGLFLLVLEQPVGSWSLFVQLVEITILTLGLLFAVVDCRVCSTLLDQLLDIVGDNKLTLDHFVEVRKEVQRRVQSAALLNNSVVLVAIVNVIGLFVCLLTSSISGFVFGVLAKEIPYLVLVFWKSAEVNEKSDRLIKALGNDKWDNDQAHTTRLRVFAAASSNPISFPLATIRMNYTQVRRQFVGWFLATLIAFGQSAIGWGQVSQLE